MERSQGAPRARFAVNAEHVASLNAGCRCGQRASQPRSSRIWTTGFRLILLLTSVISVQFISVAKAAATGDPPKSAEPFGATELSSCNLPGVAPPARCGVLEVLENPDRQDGRRLPIHVAVIPASSGKALPDPIVVLMGGPGEDAISAAAVYAAQFGRLLADRDLLLVDQRGTGRSAALKCHLFSPETAADSVREFFPVAAIQRCKQLLEVSADLTRYTYPYFARDLEQVRQALGYGPLNLFAGSYGTRAAQAYLRQYPESVRTAYLGSVVPIDGGVPLDFAKTEQTALGRTFENCETDAACHAAFPNLRGEFRQLVERLDSGAVRAHLPGNAVPVPLGRGRVVEWFRSKLYRPRDAATLPWVVHRAFAGDWSPIVDGILSRAREVDDDLSWGLFFSITCSEDLPFVREEDVARETQGTWLGDYRLRQQQAACKQWPRSTLPKDYRTPIRSSVPTLFVTGDLDGGSPLWFTDRVAEGFSNHLTVVAHGQGHTEWNECVARIYELLVRSASARGLDSQPCPAIPLPPFKMP
jgi:pimeloyl-ACP methyl ester carboxylesterase